MLRKSYDPFLVEKLQKLLNDYKKEHFIATSLPFRLVGADRHLGMIKTLLSSAKKLSDLEDKNDFLEQLASSFDVGAKKAFPDSADDVAREKFVNKLNKELDGHLYYRTIGIILKNADIKKFSYLQNLTEVKAEAKVEQKSEVNSNLKSKP